MAFFHAFFFETFVLAHVFTFVLGNFLHSDIIYIYLYSHMVTDSEREANAFDLPFSRVIYFPIFSDISSGIYSGAQSPAAWTQRPKIDMDSGQSPRSEEEGEEEEVLTENLAFTWHGKKKVQ